MIVMVCLPAADSHMLSALIDSKIQDLPMTASNTVVLASLARVHAAICNAQRAALHVQQQVAKERE